MARKIFFSGIVSQLPMVGGGMSYHHTKTFDLFARIIHHEGRYLGLNIHTNEGHHRYFGSFIMSTFRSTKYLPYTKTWYALISDESSKMNHLSKLGWKYDKEKNQYCYLAEIPHQNFNDKSNSKFAKLIEQHTSLQQIDKLMVHDHPNIKGSFFYGQSVYHDDVGNINCNHISLPL